jgi:hypothetical protein
MPMASVEFCEICLYHSLCGSVIVRHDIERCVQEFNQAAVVACNIGRLKWFAQEKVFLFPSGCCKRI